MDFVDAASELIKWFNAHQYAGGLLRKQQVMADKAPLALFLPVLTRWTSHYLSIRRLLDLQRYIEACVAVNYQALVEAAGKTRKAKDHAKKVLAHVRNPEFWNGLNKCVTIQHFSVLHIRQLTSKI